MLSWLQLLPVHGGDKFVLKNIASSRAFIPFANKRIGAEAWRGINRAMVPRIVNHHEIPCLREVLYYLWVDYVYNSRSPVDVGNGLFGQVNHRYCSLKKSSYVIICYVLLRRAAYSIMMLHSCHGVLQQIGWMCCGSAHTEFKLFRSLRKTTYILSSW